MKKKSDLRHQDPYLKRELQRYSNPLPSREWIIAVLDKVGIPVKMTELSQKLNITNEEIAFFDRRLNAMARDGQILINRRGAVCVANKLD